MVFQQSYYYDSAMQNRTSLLLFCFKIVPYSRHITFTGHRRSIAKYKLKIKCSQAFASTHTHTRDLLKQNRKLLTHSTDESRSCHLPLKSVLTSSELTDHLSYSLYGDHCTMLHTHTRIRFEFINRKIFGNFYFVLFFVSQFVEQ